ncbi:MAG: AraC family transcriptional regulator [Oscillospiraceae bacterium]
MAVSPSEYKRFFLTDMTKSDILVIKNGLDKDWPLHWHDCFEIEMVLSGSMIEVINGITYHAEPGDLFLFAPSDFHTVTITGVPVIYNIMFPDTSIDKDLLTALLTAKNKTHFRLSNEDFAYFDALLSRAVHESLAHNVYYEIIVSNTLNTIISTLLRDCQSNSMIENRQSNFLITQALLYIHAHFSENPNLQQVADVMHLNYAYFSVLFHKEVGTTFKPYITKLKLAHAKKMITASDASVTDVCFACGFDSLSHFHREFKKEFGSSPLAFKKANLPVSEQPIDRASK